MPASPNGSGDPGEDWGALAPLKSLRRMVTILTVTLTVGVLSIVAVLIVRIALEPASTRITHFEAPAVTLPAGETVTATGATSAALTFLTRDESGVERLRVFDPGTGDPRGVVEVRRTP